VRPTSDKVREAIFDILGSLGGLEGAQVADLFAGSGALGIEALSRGAERVTFVDRDPLATAAIKSNLERLGMSGPGAKVVTAEVGGWLGRERLRFDVAFCDPPYSFDGWEKLLGRLDADIVFLESSRPVEPGERFAVRRVYRYGGTLVTVAESRRASPPKDTT
jgi:16S rRNA (guanine966-N2)-methyltransferase